jgi:hypothetical protein
MRLFETIIADADTAPGSQRLCTHRRACESGCVGGAAGATGRSFARAHNAAPLTPLLWAVSRQAILVEMRYSARA